MFPQRRSQPVQPGGIFLFGHEFYPKGLRMYMGKYRVFFKGAPQVLNHEKERPEPLFKDTLIHVFVLSGSILLLAKCFSKSKEALIKENLRLLASPFYF